MKHIYRTGIVFMVILSFLFLCGMQQAPSAPTGSKSTPSSYPYLIDNFEDGDFSRAPEWFTFDNITATVQRNTALKSGDAAVVDRIGSFSLALKGSTNRWYVGGMGTMLGIDATKFRSFEMDVYGNGENSGKIKVELYDDDNKNNEIEVDKNWVPTKDDLWSYEIEVNWKGWKHVSIPFSNFKLVNPGKGDGVFNPDLAGGSGGLVKLQLIFVANSETGTVDYSIDNIELAP
jgi:hypothetical protein